jgi:hypothetical protein
MFQILVSLTGTSELRERTVVEGEQGTCRDNAACVNACGLCVLALIPLRACALRVFG